MRKILGPELLTNPGFETAGGGGADLFGSWTETVGDGAIADEGALVHGGAHAAKLTAGATANTNLFQSPAVVAGVTYTFSFWTRGDGTNDGIFALYAAPAFTPLIGGGDTPTGVTGTTYQQVSYTFVAPAGCTGLYLYLSCPTVNGGIAYFDDVSVKKLDYRKTLLRRIRIGRL